jgi:TDG/mug DNA glycosylase family protein
MRLTRIRSFAPIADSNASILILGSMPGIASLNANEYYAHPRNAFWRIMAELLPLDKSATYIQKVEALGSAHIALWDVLQSCSRQGSLDAKIGRQSEVANDFVSFFRSHPQITQVFFNGAKAEAFFRRQVLAEVDTSAMRLMRLPSTSPAHAALPFVGKLKAWRALLQANELNSQSA